VPRGAGPRAGAGGHSLAFSERRGLVHPQPGGVKGKPQAQPHRL